MPLTCPRGIHFCVHKDTNFTNNFQIFSYFFVAVIFSQRLNRQAFQSAFACPKSDHQTAPPFMEVKQVPVPSVQDKADYRNRPFFRSETLTCS